jgi:hypothetical protein
MGGGNGGFNGGVYKPCDGGGVCGRFGFDVVAFGAAVMVVLGGSMGRIHHVKWEICWPNLLVSAVVTAQLATT